MLLYRTLFVIDVIVMLVLTYFFVDGLQYSPSGASQIIWLPILAVPAAIMFAAAVLHARGRNRLATWLLAVLAIPPALFVGFFGLLLFLNPNWH